MDYTVMGDHVNLAARVEKLTRDYNAKIIVTESTIKHLDVLIKKGLVGHYQLKELETVRVKGKEKEIKIFELKGLRHGEI
jgi:adenylate cyclase